MRTGMRLLPMHPEYLCPGLLQHFFLFLNRGGIDPILGIHYPPGAFLFCLQHPADTFHSVYKALFFRESIPIKCFTSIPEIPRKRFFYNNMFILLQRSYYNGFMCNGRCADMDYI